MGNRPAQITHASVSGPWVLTEWTEYEVPTVHIQGHNRPVVTRRQFTVRPASTENNQHLNTRESGIRQYPQNNRTAVRVHNGRSSRSRSEIKPRSGTFSNGTIR
ncbi:unnamed protein product [Adineta ricciae]|uniref:Uncharacterized protein n=1 Tax=Adineta ricciae TaxID=249248 RepID=A0A815QRZ5_ADIRI|nr:unnamed protein product [Adineta ricciae]